ncbi:Regulator of G-protein signaling 7 isoform 1 [Schistosoma japonicum]|uniref:Regulator of G-protein signaling 7 isoform 1 n=2 Tax=Schistosoma japonicum TaxID=6182 RepID=A0A4Z2DQS2_SCHJA|nr:Regulator of G-protein signaling 7 isoform 1 [Schistosoma japonicum]
MVNHIRSMACRHVQNMVQSVSKCSGNETPYSPIVDTNCDSPSTPPSKGCKTLNQSEKNPEPHSVCDVKCPSKSCITPGISKTCDFHYENDQQLSAKCVQSKKVSTEDLDDRQSPNDYLLQKLEALIDQMISEEDGIPVRNVKSLMSVIPSTFTGSDIVHWLMEHTGASDVTEAVHLASRIASMGYIFCIDDHVLTVKNDGHTYYRFQTPFLYPSRCMEADTVDYAVYLCKRTMQNKQRLELAGFEAERLASLQNIYCHKWEFIYIQAEAEAKVDKKRDKLERLVLESQERAYWDLHRPPPGCINTTDIDMRKLCRAKRPKKTTSRPINFPIPSGPDGSILFSILDGLSLRDRIDKLHACSRTRIKSSKAAESLQNFADQYSEFDLLLSTSTSVSFSTLSGTGINQPNTTASTGQLTSGALNVNPNSSTSAAASASILRTSGDKLIHHTRSISATGFNGITSLTSMSLVRTSSGTAGNGTQNIATSGQIPTGHGSAGYMAIPACTPNSVYDPNQEPVSALNPWISDNPDYWNTDLRPKYLPIRRIKRWSFSIHELLKDPVGLEEFQRWLEKEFSAENLRFWQACQVLKGAPLREVRQSIMSIYQQYLAPNAVEPINIDSRIADLVRRHIDDESNTTLNRYCFEAAEEHIFHLMKSDSYCRFLRSDVYRELFRGGKKKSKKQRSGISAGVGGGSAPVTAAVNFTGIE